MKVLKKKDLADKGQEVHTKAEWWILEKITHPFIVKLYFAFQTPQKLYFVMDYLNGGELFTHLK